ncbi:hypothetical protein SLS56_009860 [Neofusicoccum ribis]|uniref:LAGLIDADG endonuclease n=1 Tax=Neofusicoccum ribis TaxID=45134 RepID=A0ABR3SGM4_9PEZI
MLRHICFHKEVGTGKAKIPGKRKNTVLYAELYSNREIWRLVVGQKTKLGPEEWKNKTFKWALMKNIQ